MPIRLRAAVLLGLLAGPLAAAEPPFATELAIGFGCKGSATQRPVVVLDGIPSSASEYSADGRAPTVDVAATRWFAPVDDDGRAPFALLPYVARSPSVTARFALTGTSRNSFGSFSGQEPSLEVRLAGDGSLREADPSAEWFFGKSLAVRLGEHEVSATGSYGETDLTREDASAFTGSAQPFFSTLTSAGIVRRAKLAAAMRF